ncbi:MAG: hypothetical protein Q4G69_13705, partial [Planctomycetia bacterium]|nr:hypothetical protein [Planctomycetia bacterium]
RWDGARPGHPAATPPLCDGDEISKEHNLPLTRVSKSADGFELFSRIFVLLFFIVPHLRCSWIVCSVPHACAWGYAWCRIFDAGLFPLPRSSKNKNYFKEAQQKNLCDFRINSGPSKRPSVVIRVYPWFQNPWSRKNISKIKDFSKSLGANLWF